MKKIWKYFFLLLSTSAGAQNLVSNPDFETYSSCPSGPDELYKAVGWNSFRNTPDYFHTCATVVQFSVPYNNFGYQQPYSGNAYGGFWAFDYSSSYREIIGRQLSDVLTIGQKYYVSFEVALIVYGQCGCDKIGAKFSTVPFSFTSPAPINNFAHVYSSVAIIDTINWTRVSGSFIADSAYNYIMLGNFFDNANTDTTQIIGNPNCTAYYYLDNVCVSTDSLTCNPSPELIGEYNNDFLSEVFPNPAGQYLIIKSNRPIKTDEIKFYNLLSQPLKLESTELGGNKYLLQSSVPDGIYMLSVNDGNKRSISKKIIIHN